MNARICKYATAFVILLSLGFAGCDNNSNDDATEHLTGPARVSSTLVTAEPVLVTPVFVSSPFCLTPPLFQAGFTLLVRTDQELLVSGIGFEFLDRFGRLSVPTAIPTSSTGTSFVPLPLPNSSAIPIPDPMMFGVPAGNSTSLPLLLQFGCGVPASGTLIVSVNTSTRGKPEMKRVSLHIGN